MSKFSTAKELVNYLKSKSFQLTQQGGISLYTMNISGVMFIFDIVKNSYSISKKGLPISADRETSKDLTKPENHSVVMLLITLLTNGYDFDSITLEKKLLLAGVRFGWMLCYSIKLLRLYI